MQGSPQLIMLVDIAQYFSEHPNASYALIILNQSINVYCFEKLYRQASMRVCADGGYDRLLAWCSKEGIALDEPQYIIGDLDSIEIQKGPKRIYIEDQSRNDLQKCLDFLIKQGQSEFLVIGALGGRLDHELASLSVLYQYAEKHIIYVTEKSVMTLLGVGVNELCVQGLGPHCGFVPLIGAALVSTKGFKWNLDGDGTNVAYRIFYSLSRIVSGTETEFIK